MIDIKKIETGFAIAFPFELKNTFRSQFPSARWNNTLRRWEVGPRSGKRLGQWVAEVNASGFLEELDNLDNLEMTEKELRSLRGNLEERRNELKEIEGRKENLLKLKGELQDTADRLSEYKEAINRLRSEVVEVQTACEQERQRIAAQLEGAIDMAAVLAAKRQMGHWINGVGRRAREEFDKAQAVVIAERNKLTALGLYSPALNELADVNFNRPDRDHPKFIDDESLWIVKERKHD